MKKILVATDLSSRSDRAISRAIKLAKKYEAKLDILHVIDEETPQSLIEETKKIAHQEISYCIKGKTKELEHDIHIIIGSPYLEIIKFSNEENSDLIILGLHRHTDSNEPMIGRVIERVVKNSMKPVLVVKNRSELDYKNILIAVDFNIHSKKSLKLAFDIFRDCNFSLLHSYQLPFLGTAGKGDILEQQVKDNCLSDLEEIIKEATPKNIDKNKINQQINKKIVRGSILDILADEIIYSKPELLVLGSHGRTGLAKMISVNVTENFLVNPACDVLVVI